MLIFRPIEGVLCKITFYYFMKQYFHLTYFIKFDFPFGINKRPFLNFMFSLSTKETKMLFLLELKRVLIILPKGCLIIS